MNRLLKIVLLLAALGAASAAAADNPELPKIEGPVLITGFGQSQDTNNVNILCRRLKIDADYKLDVPSCSGAAAVSTAARLTPIPRPSSLPATASPARPCRG